jgi:hypothetical protein
LAAVVDAVPERIAHESRVRVDEQDPEVRYQLAINQSLDWKPDCSASWTRRQHATCMSPCAVSWCTWSGRPRSIG